MSGVSHRCLYIGHGQSKVAYRLTDDGSPLGQAVLKLTASADNEPHVCQQLQEICHVDEDRPSVKMCPDIYAIGHCLELDDNDRPLRRWFAWLSEYAMPLDKYMLTAETHGLNVDHKACLKLALLKQVLAAKSGLLLSDCLLYTSPSPRDATLSRMPSSA